MSKFSKTTDLLGALNISIIYGTIIQNCLSLWNRLFNVCTPKLKHYVLTFTHYLLYINIVPGTLLSKIIKSGQSPVKCAIVVDSSRMVLPSEKFIKLCFNPFVLV